MNIVEAISRVVEKRDLSQEQARQVMGQIMSGAATDAQIGSFITALRMKGETVAEIAGSAQAMREKSLKVSIVGPTVDTCGTGGDASGTFNISTTAAFVVAACGVTVAKHGNRSISSQSGSADVLKALGVKIDADLAVVETCIQQAGIGFLFAPRHHSAMRHAMGPRQELSIRTIFNLLGPLTNPAGALRQLIGVYDGALTEPMARVLGRLGSEHALVVHGSDGLDELTTTGPSRVSELREDGAVATYTVEPGHFGLARATRKDLQGGDAETNAAITRSVLAGEKGPRRDIVILNAGAALCVAGVSPNIGAGIKVAVGAIASGEASRRLQQLVDISNREQ